MHLYVYVSICIHVYTCIPAVSARLCTTQAHIYTYAYLNKCIYMSMHLYACMYMNVYRQVVLGRAQLKPIHIHIHTFINASICQCIYMYRVYTCIPAGSARSCTPQAYIYAYSYLYICIYISMMYLYVYVYIHVYQQAVLVHLHLKPIYMHIHTSIYVSIYSCINMNTSIYMYSSRKGWDIYTSNIFIHIYIPLYMHLYT